MDGASVRRYTLAALAALAFAGCASAPRVTTSALTVPATSICVQTTPSGGCAWSIDREYYEAHRAEYEQAGVREVLP